MRSGLIVEVGGASPPSPLWVGNQLAPLRSKILGGIMNAQHEKFREVSKVAHDAGHQAATTIIPTPMVVVGRDPETGRTYEYEPIADGVCGFAWIWFKSNTSWARWAKKNLRVGKGYPNGLRIWVNDYRQSLTRKEAYAEAYAKVLREELGIEAYGMGRMD